MQINNNIEEQRVGFDNAKLLKEKGFEVKCTHYYILDFSSFKADMVLHQFKTPIEDNKNILQLCSTTKQPHLALAPTTQSAVAWLFTNFGIHINVWSDTNLNLPEYLNSAKWFYVINCNLNDCYNSQGNVELIYNTPEEAREAAISFVLINLLK